MPERLPGLPARQCDGLGVAGPGARLWQLAPLFDALEDVLAWIKDRKGRYQWVNRAFQLNHSLSSGPAGCEEPQILGKTDYDLSPAFVADQFRLDDEQVLAGRRVVNRIELVTQAGGLTSWNVTNKIPLLNARGQVEGTAGITRALRTAEDPGGPEGAFAPVLAHLREHYATAVTNQELARMARMSVRAFERKFLGSFHVPPQKYLRRLRLQMASRALVYTGRPLVEVALGCGFGDQSHFTREFRRFFGRTPRDYRQHYAPGAGAAPGTESAGSEQ